MPSKADGSCSGDNLSEIKIVESHQNNSSQALSVKKEQNKSFLSFSRIKDAAGIEVVMFLFMFSFMSRSVTSTTMVMDKVCLVHLGFSENVCKNLSSYPEQKSHVEKLSTNYSLGLLLLQMLPSSILSCFMGAWSDEYGRKPPIMIALAGIIVDGVISTICAAVLYSRVEYYLISAIFSGFSGGLVCVLTVLYSYASDTTPFSKRTMKYTVMEIVFGLSIPMGQVSGGWIYEYGGYVPVFMVSTGGQIISLAWVTFFLEETKGLHSVDHWKVKFKRMWSTEPAIRSFKATIKYRPNKGREQILLLVVSMGLTVLGSSSTVNISYLYAHHLYDWNNKTFSTVSAILAVISTIAVLITVPIFKRMKLGDPALGIAGTISLVLKNIGTGMATRPGIYILANLVGVLTGLSTLAGRSRISKVTSKDDIGKVFAFLTTAESLVPIIATVIVSQIFNATLDIYPGLIFLVLACPLVIPFGVFIWLAILPPVNYEDMHNTPLNDHNLEPSVTITRQERY